MILRSPILDQRNKDGQVTKVLERLSGFLPWDLAHLEAAQMLIEAGNVKAIAVDTLSLDHGMSPDFAVHNEWLPSGRYGIEGIANLGALPAAGATLIVGAPKVRGGTGGPARIFAMV